MVASSTGTRSRFSQMSSLHGPVHWRWWMEPWTSSMQASSNPARWNWPSTLEVTTKARRPSRSIQPRSRAKPWCGTVAR